MEITLEMVKEGLINGAIDGDGHGIVSPAYYVERGFPLALIKELEREIPSGSGKYAITRPDGTVGKVTGIACLSFHYWAAHSLGVKFAESLGRGTQARNIRDAIRAWAELES
jgi:hypothetical protein